MMARRSKPKPQRHIGGLPPRYLFALNPHVDYRASKCPNCDHLTYERKFVLLIHVDPENLIALGKSCRYCPKCELIIAHQSELESEMVRLFERRDPSAIGNRYLVLGTVEVKEWREGLIQPKTIADMLPHVADFKGYRTIEYQPGGWYPVDK